ncbi:ankyrin repeat protein [Microdochium bolleyi]|uniref:Ankyrin repeat protein n=1 Tax=Microdochium bolleyi TaxID=196109 RepID=A0A136IJD3_9PEZI|nr:ankyrin repeat protein [Microdochium bolleyi]
MMVRLRREDYTVGWVCPLEVEQIAALHMLDTQHDPIPQPATDHNVYNLGSIAGHNVVIAGLPQAGDNSAAAVVTQLRTTFPNVKFGLLVGIGGGVPVTTDSGMIRLGDVIVSKPTGPHSGAVQYDHGKARAGSFQRTGALAPPPAVLLNVAQALASKRAMERDDPIAKSIERIDKTIRTLRHYAYPGAGQDRLFKADYVHQQHGVPCDESGCEASQRIARRVDGADDMYIRIHRGTIASGELVLKDAILRDRLAKDGLICFEMEAAGALTDFPCLVIRGVSDYCDSHKNDMWHGYAAAAAAAYARQLFFHMPIDEIQQYVPV